MNCVIHVIETHPYKDNIAFTADYKGEVHIYNYYIFDIKINI